MTYGQAGLRLEPPLTAAWLLTTLPVPPTAPASTSLSSNWLTPPVPGPYWFTYTLLDALYDLWKEKKCLLRNLLELLWHLGGGTGLPKSTPHRVPLIHNLQGDSLLLKYTLLSVYYVPSVFTSNARVGCACVEVFSWPTFAVDTSIPWSQWPSYRWMRHQCITTPTQHHANLQTRKKRTICSLDGTPNPKMEDRAVIQTTEVW